MNQYIQYFSAYAVGRASSVLVLVSYVDLDYPINGRYLSAKWCVARAGRSVVPSGSASTCVVKFQHAPPWLLLGFFGISMLVCCLVC